MTDWQDALNLMKENGKKNRPKGHGTFGIGLRCWECGMYIDNLNMGHYCTRCLVIKLRNLSRKSCTGDHDQSEDTYDDEHFEKSSEVEQNN